MDQTSRSPLHSLIYMALFAALMATTALFSVYVSTIPFTLQTFFVVLAAVMLNPREAFGAMALYAFLGAVGLPVFAGGQAGLSALLGPTGGFIIGFIIAASLGSLLLKSLQIRTKNDEKPMAQVISSALVALVVLAVVYLCGAAWFMYSAQMPLWPALLATVIPFIIPDLIKAAVAITVGLSLKRILQKTEQ